MTKAKAFQIDNESTKRSCDLKLVSSNQQRNDSAWFRQLYQQHASVLVRCLRKAFGDGPPDPEDVAQETFRKLAEKDNLSEIKHFQAFLWRMARNIVLNELRKEGVRSRYDFEVEQLFFAIEGPEKSPERVQEVRQQLDIINDTLDAMPQRRRNAFVLIRVDGLTFADAGRELGISPRAVVKHVSRAMSDIQAALNILGGTKD